MGEFIKTVTITLDEYNQLLIESKAIREKAAAIYDWNGKPIRFLSESDELKKLREINEALNERLNYLQRPLDEN